MGTISVRINELNFYGKILKENRSEVVRELIEEGKKMKAIELYKSQKVSLGLAAKLSGLVLSEFIDLLENYNVKLNLDLENAKLAMETAEKILK